MPSLALRNISKRFGAHQALESAALPIEPREVVAIIRRSGSGKSALSAAFNGLERPDAGTIELSGANPQFFSNLRINFNAAHSSRLVWTSASRVEKLAL